MVPELKNRLQNLQIQTVEVKTENNLISELHKIKSKCIDELREDLSILNTFIATLDDDLLHITLKDAKTRVGSCKKTYDQILKKIHNARTRVDKQDALISKMKVYVLSNLRKYIYNVKCMHA